MHGAARLLHRWETKPLVTTLPLPPLAPVGRLRARPQEQEVAAWGVAGLSALLLLLLQLEVPLSILGLFLCQGQLELWRERAQVRAKRRKVQKSGRSLEAPGRTSASAGAGTGGLFAGGLLRGRWRAWRLGKHVSDQIGVLQVTREGDPIVA